MRREVVWSAWDGAGAEHLLLAVGQDGAVADGLVVGVAGGGRPFRISYEVRCDASWSARAVRVSAPGLDPVTPVVDLLADGEGNWTTRRGESVPELAGCVDVDISATPFTGAASDPYRTASYTLWKPPTANTSGACHHQRTYQAEHPTRHPLEPTLLQNSGGYRVEGSHEKPRHAERRRCT